MKTLRRLPAAAAIAALALGLGTAIAAPGDRMPATPTMDGPTRAEVREDLKDARAMNTMTPGGELGDTADVLEAREAFNALQSEVLAARAIDALEAAVVALLLDHDF